ncbi:hypothetical protein V6Z12_A05G446000 [Gossypium hirsutum]
MGVIKSAMVDAPLTSILRPFPLAAFFITTLLVSLMMFIFTIIDNALGSATFNPTDFLSCYAVGLKKDWSTLSMVVRFSLQATGGVVGVKTILGTGFLIERLLRFGLCLALLVILVSGSNNPLLKLLLMAISTVGFVGRGANYTGPSMNPVNAFGWAYVNNWYTSWELYYVYWMGPLIGATLAAWVFRFLLSPLSSTKEKKA